MIKIYSLLLTSLFYVVINAQTTVTITADRDNTIFSDNTNNSNGAGEYILFGTTNSAGRRRGLLHYNLSAIPPGSTITAVTLSIYCSKVPNNTFPPTNVLLHKLTNSWGEGTSNAPDNEGPGTAATPNDATWTHRFFTTSMLWTRPGGDFITTPTASAPVNAVGQINFSNPELVADVQGWVNSPENNFGYILLASNEASGRTIRHISSREASVVAQRPQITVTYAAGALPVRLKSFNATLAKQDAVLIWKTATETDNAYFDIEHSTNGILFSSVGKVTGNGTSTSERSYTFTHYNLSAGKHYYRLAQHDLSGRIEYSSVVMVTAGTNVRLQVSPNPVVSKLNLTAPVSLQGGTFVIQSAAGQIMQKGIILSNTVDVKSLTPGLYWISIQSEKQLFRSSFMKQ